MEALKDAAEAATLYAGGRPLKWEEWKRYLMQDGDALTAEEIGQLESILAARGGPPSMKQFFDDYAEKLALFEEQQAACSQEIISNLEDAAVVVSVSGLTIREALATDLVAGQHYTGFSLRVAAECAVRLRLDPRQRDQHLLLVLWRWDGALVGVSSAADGQAQMDRRLQPGDYTLLTVLLPRRDEARATDSQHASRRLQLFTVSAAGDVQLTAAYVAHLRQLFRLWDCSGSGGLSRHEFSAFNELTAGEPVRDEEWDIVTANFETSAAGELTEAGFLKLHQMEAEDNVSEPSELWLSLTALGFGPQLEPRRLAAHRLSVLTADGDASAVALTAAGVSALGQRTAEALLRRLALSGHPVSGQPGWRRVSLQHVVLLIFANLQTSSVQAKVDTSRCSNSVSLMEGPVTVPAGGCALAQCLLREDCIRPWGTDITVSTELVLSADT